MPRLPLFQIEQALLAKLAPLKTSLGVRQLGPYAGDVTPEEIGKVVQNWPAVLVMYMGKTIEDLGVRKIAHMVWAVVACDRNPNNPALARQGGANNPGTYAMLDACEDLLDNKEITVGDALFPVLATDDASEFQGNGISIYSAMYEIKQGYLAQ